MVNVITFSSYRVVEGFFPKLVSYYFKVSFDFMVDVLLYTAKIRTLKNSPTSAGSNRSSLQDEPGLNKVTGAISPNRGHLLLCELVKEERLSF